MRKPLLLAVWLENIYEYKKKIYETGEWKPYKLSDILKIGYQQIQNEPSSCHNFIE